MRLFREKRRNRRGGLGGRDDLHLRLVVAAALDLYAAVGKPLGADYDADLRTLRLEGIPADIRFEFKK